MKKEAQSVSFREPLSSDVAKQQNQVLGDRFVKYGVFLLDTENNFAPVGLLAVANNIFLKKYHDIMKGHDKK